MKQRYIKYGKNQNSLFLKMQKPLKSAVNNKGMTTFVKNKERNS